MEIIPSTQPGACPIRSTTSAPIQNLARPDSRRRPIQLLILCLSLLQATTARSAQSFPGPDPGAAQATVQGNLYTLENNVISMTWDFTGGAPTLAKFRDVLHQQSWVYPATNVFALSSGNHRSFGSISFQRLGLPILTRPTPVPLSPRVGDRIPGWKIAATLLEPETGLEVEWEAVLRDGANYVRQQVGVRSRRPAEPLTRFVFLNWENPGPATIIGDYPGSPILAGHAFLSAESPFAIASVQPRSIQMELNCHLPLDAGQSYEFSTVFGVVPATQLRRGFGYYLNRERARAYHQLLTWNSWFDFIWDVNENGMLQSMRQLDLELRQRRGVTIDSFAIDDGWDLPETGFWAIDPSKFPHRFTPLQRQAEAAESHLSLWISPLGGYDSVSSWQQRRTVAAQREGLIPSDLDLSQPNYYAWWTNRCLSFLAEYDINYLKWDNAGFGLSSHFMALMRSAEVFRAATPHLYINASVGTWPSPFWLHFVDSIWRGGQDADFAGVGDSRERWLTYRDGEVYANVVQRGGLFPLNSLMTHGVIHGAFAEGPLVAQAGTNLRNEVRTYFGSGTQLQELYVTPSLMTSNSWNQLAEAARWARANEEVLVDTHWVGGDPRELQPYGWAAWTPEKGILVLRNPSNQTNSIAIDAGRVFELPTGAAQVYDLCPAFPDQELPASLLQAGASQPILLRPFEVMVIEALPRRTYPEQVRSLLPLAYWRFDEGVSNRLIAADSMGSHHGALLNGAELAVPGAFAHDNKGSLTLTELGARLQIPFSHALNFSSNNEFSISLWINPERLQGTQALLSNRGPKSGFALAIVGDSLLRFISFAQGALDVPLAPLQSNQWHQIVLVRKSNGTDFYQDGDLLETVSSARLEPSKASLVFGGHPDTTEEAFTGRLDEVALFPTALSPAQVKLLYQSRSGLSLPPVIIQPPVSAVRLEGSTATFRVTATGARPLSYQWHLDGVPIPGATQDTLTLSEVDQTQSGTHYSVRVSNDEGSSESSSASLLVQRASSYAQAVIGDRPVGYWRLGETLSRTIADDLGEARGLAALNVDQGTPGAVASDSNSAMGFDGTFGTRIEIPFHPHLNTPVFSVECWARSTGGSGGYRSPITSRELHPLSGYCIYASPADRWEFWTATQQSDANAWNVIPGPSIERSEWTHLSGTSDGATNSFFVNGRLVGRSIGTLAPNLTRPLRIGAGATESIGDFHFVGNIDEVALYNYALDVQQIERHYWIGSGRLKLSWQRQGESTLIQWPAGILEHSKFPSGPWTPVPQAVSPWPVPLPANQGFYRIRL